MERGRRIELLALAWKAKVLPLYEPRIKEQKAEVEVFFPKKDNPQQTVLLN